jgi:hypothetical protein
VIPSILLEYDIIMEAKYFYLYSLKQDKGVYLLTVDDRIVGGYSDSETVVAGENITDAAIREKAIDFMIQKILEKPKSHMAEQPKLKALGMSGDFKIDLPKLEAALRSALAP